jgi:hypothetical protein
MILTDVHSVPVPSSKIVKMEERKRSAPEPIDGTGPPRKIQATGTTNGVSRSHRDDDMPGKDELEVSLSNLSHGHKSKTEGIECFINRKLTRLYRGFKRRQSSGR